MMQLVLVCDVGNMMQLVLPLQQHCAVGHI
jgi:hypothetical protein